ncbi:hypothetical protein [Bradyrhizobium sp. CCBAU 11386]|uniref:hypothetical protein n=1 Tax=Bradyrhizobium sp. CCBAU 11386 TaxID=1630837 RepID=UPI0023045800|nr:hypothetical protein [Bradyrhizobium sp. CCBAU 11386]
MRRLTLSRSDTRVRIDVEERNLFCIRLHFVLEERIGVEKISAERFLTIDEAVCRRVVVGRNLRRQKSWAPKAPKFRDHRKHDDDLVLHRGRRPAEGSSSRALLFALLGEAFEDLDAELFCRRALDLPELIPEPDHFALFFDGHESPPKGFQKTIPKDDGS